MNREEMVNSLGGVIAPAMILTAADKVTALVRDETGATGAEPYCVVRPETLEQLAEVIKWARKTATPLVPVSSAGPHYRGDTLLARPGVVVDMAAFDKIITINRRNRVALFQAGVDFAQLSAEAKKSGLQAMMPLLPKAGKSALAAYLEREPTIYPRYQWDLADPLLCLEVVWGTGDIFRTGSAAGPGTIEEQWKSGEYQKSPMGPGQNDWSRMIQGAQGSMAIATWCSAKCEIRSSFHHLHVASSDKVEPLIEASYEMLRGKLTDIHFILDARAFASLTMAGPSAHENILRQVKPWNLVYSVSGLAELPEERGRLFEKRCRAILGKLGIAESNPPGISADELLRLLEGPSPEPYWKTRPFGAMREVFFQTTMDRVPAFLEVFGTISASAGLKPERTGVYIQPQLGGRACHLEFIIGYDPKNKEEAGKVNAFADNAIVPLMEKGAFFSRPYGAWTRPVMDAARTTAWIYRRVKSVFDPDGILSPGRLGLEGGKAHV